MANHYRSGIALIALLTLRIYSAQAQLVATPPFVLDPAQATAASIDCSPVRGVQVPLSQDPAPAPTAAIETPPLRQVQVWGKAEFRGYVLGDQVAPNGQEYSALFRLDLDFNLWLWRSQGLYLFLDTEFWGQRATPGVTNASQGAFDFSKREYDLTVGLAWNYASSLEARFFAYSFNNLNRGDSPTAPIGYADGVGFENRWYLSPIYAELGTEAFDVSRATFLSVGFYPTKDLVDSQGRDFKPGPFAEANLTLDLCGETCYLYADLEFIATKSCTPRMFTLDAGVAIRPWSFPPRVEFRLGTTEEYDLPGRELETTLYGAVRILY